MTLTLGAQRVEDLVANVGPDEAAVSSTVVVDRTAPTSAGSIAAKGTTGTSVPVAYTASDGSGVGVASVQAFYSTSSSLTSPQACGSVSSSAAGGTITCTIPAVDATYRVYTRATDALGTVEAAPGAADDSIVRDTVKPGASVKPGKPASNTGSVSYTITFTESVTGLTQDDLVLGGTAAGCSLQGFSAGDSSATVTAAGCGNGSVTLALEADAVEDIAANTGPDAPADADVVVMDTIKPTVGVPTVTPRTGVPLNGSSIPVTVAWAGGDNAGGAGIAGLHAPAQPRRRLDVVDARERPDDDQSHDDRAIEWHDALPRARDRQGGQHVLVRDRRVADRAARPAELELASGTRAAGRSPRRRSSPAGPCAMPRPAGRAAAYTFTGKSIAVVSTRSSSRGAVRIYLDGVLQATVDTYRARRNTAR